MKVVYGTDTYIGFKRPMGVGLGNFDGLHIGHLALINTLTTESDFNSFDSVLYTFNRHTKSVVNKNLHIPLLLSRNKKIDLLRRTSLDYLYFEEFNNKFSKMSPELFVKDILIDKLNMKLVVVGFNYKFGHMGQGDARLLQNLGRKHGFKVIIIEPVKQDNIVVSSTLIRENVIKGNMSKVSELLGRYHSITGIVQRGRKIGRTIGFPTANIYPDEGIILPDNGVFLSRVVVEGEMYHGVTNIGINPTFGGLDNRTVETHILNFGEHYIYGKTIEVFLIKKIRGEKRFDDVGKLVEQIRRDIDDAKEYI